MGEITGGFELKKADSVKRKPAGKAGGGRGELLAAIKSGAALKKAEARDSSSVDNVGKYGEVIDGAWVMKKPPSGMDMFAEMNWKKQAKRAKEEWEATGAAGQAAGGNEQKARTPAMVDTAAATAPAPAARLPPLPTVTAPTPSLAPAPAQTPSMQRRPARVSESAPVAAAQATAQLEPTPLAFDGSLGPVAIEQLKQELIASFRAEIQTAKADILAEIKHMLDSR